MLKVEHLSRSYRGIPAISDVSFEVRAGEIAGFLGPNGAGKSTTVKIITGLLRPNDGRVLFEGQDIHAGLDRLARDVRIHPGGSAPVRVDVGHGVSAAGGPAARDARAAD